MLTWHQRADEVERRMVHRVEVALGVVALVEDQRHMLDLFGQEPTAGHQLVGEAGEGRGVMLVARVGGMEERHVEVRGDQQGHPDDAQRGSPFFALAPLGQHGPLVERVDEGKEVRRVEE
jgi:hypothetical protein